jgi:hypothetical protein
VGEKRILLGIPEGKRPFKRPRHRWEGTVETYLKEWNWKAWIRLRISTIGRHLGIL